MSEEWYSLARSLDDETDWESSLPIISLVQVPHSLYQCRSSLAFKVLPLSPDNASTSPAWHKLFLFLFTVSSAFSNCTDPGPVSSSALVSSVSTSSSKIVPKWVIISEKIPAGIPRVGEKTMPMLRSVILLRAEFWTMRMRCATSARRRA